MQTQFFDPTQPPPETPPSERAAVKRIFLYDNQVFEDPGPEYSAQDVLSFLAQTYPELGNGTWTSRTLPDGTEEITFVKVTGEKGSENSVTPRHLIAALERLTPTEIEAISLLDQLAAEGETVGAATLLALAPDIEAALHQAERISNDSQRIVSQCLALTPIPQSRVPLGF